MLQKAYKMYFLKRKIDTNVLSFNVKTEISKNLALSFLSFY